MEANMAAVSYEILEENEGNLSHDNALEHYLSPHVIKENNESPESVLTKNEESKQAEVIESEKKN